MNKKNKIIHSKLLFFVILPLFFFTSYVRAEEAIDVEFESKFKNGEILQNCGLGCMFKWGLVREDLKKLNTEGKWLQLAEKTANIKYSHELAHYYLAKSALKLGYYDAALIYISQSKDKTISCLPTTCDGINVEEEFNQFKQEINEAKANPSNNKNNNLRAESSNTNQTEVTSEEKRESLSPAISQVTQASNSNKNNAEKINNTENVNNSDIQEESTSKNNGSLGRALSSIFGGKGAKLEKLVESNDIDGALAFYESEKVYFAENQKENLKNLQILAKKLNERYLPPIQSIKSKLEFYNLADLLPAAWPSIKADLQESDTKTSEFNRISLFEAINARSKTVNELILLSEEIKKQLNLRAGDSFLRFDLYSGISFFDGYPVSLDSTRMFESKTQEISNKVCSTNSEKIAQFTKTYRSYLPDNF